MIFQSLGSNYTLKKALQLLFARGNGADQQRLITWLEKHYGGIAYLYDKGRDGLAVALKNIGSPNTAINGITCSVLFEAVNHAGADITYLDVDEDGNFSLESLKAALQQSSPPRAVIIQNTYGNPCDIVAIEKLAAKHKFIIIEDLAHSLGQTYADGREVGTVGDIIMLSFGRDKVTDVVNGGAIIVREPRLLGEFHAAKKVRSFRVQLRDRFYPILTWLARRTYRIYLGRLIVRAMYGLHVAEHSADGGIRTNYTMPGWQAKRALAELRDLEKNTAHRHAINQVYIDELGNLIPTADASLRVPLLARNRTKLLSYLAESHYYLADTWYDVPIGPKRKYQKINYPEAENPKSVTLTKHLINLPTHININEKKASRLATLIKEFYDRTN